MEAAGRPRSGGSAKTSKNSGKNTKALTAEEEARRREELKEKLSERLELEKKALKIVERLLEDRVTEDFLVDCARFIAPANYKDTVEERFIAKLCGYPICSKKLGKIPTQQYKISTKTNKVYDITERKCFCSNFCYKASKEFELQISTTPLWLRQHETPQEIKLMKKGDGGRSGEEVMLLARRLQEEDIENPLATQPEDLHSSQQGSAAAAAAACHGHSEGSDIEQEQDFVSSLVSQQQEKPRVHWADLPKRSDEDGKGGRGNMDRRKKQKRDGSEKEFEGHRTQRAVREGEITECENGHKSRDTVFEKQKHSLNTDKPNGEQVPEECGLPDEPSMEEATERLNLYNLSESVTCAPPAPDDSTSTQAENTPLLTSPPCKDSHSSAESKHLPSSALTLNHSSPDAALPSQSGLKITQVGMSKRGAAGLRDLLRNQIAEDQPDSVRLKLLECLRRTLKDWSTDKTLEFLYGAEHSPGLRFADVKQEKEVGEEEEELDEDDLEDEDGEEFPPDVQKRPSATAPDYQILQQETQQLELRVREFYKGTWILPEEVKEPHDNKVTAPDFTRKDPALPLIDSNAQHIIQKRITVEKLTSCLGNIVGPLRLTMSDISTDLINLVRTFRFTNKNIIHKTPEWTLLAVVLLHLLCEVSPLVRDALETPASVEYLQTLMQELGLQEQDLLNLVQLFKTPAC